MIVALTGFMGSGKSSVGRKLAKLLSSPFIDLDDYIVAKAGMTIPDIFASSGEEAFRSLETSSLSEILLSTTGSSSLSPDEVTTSPATRSSDASPLSSDGDTLHHSANLVLSLGGGTILSEENAALIAAHCRCVFLRASLETIRERLSGETAGRPMLQRADIGELFASRAAAYSAAADIIIDTDHLSPSDIAVQIAAALKV